MLYKPHPWHGIPIGEKAPHAVNAYIEIVPTDTMKYEIDKKTGYLMVDRPQQFSNICPTLYGIIPQTFCADRVTEVCIERTGRENIVGDKDPLDICVITESNILHGDILVHAVPIGGLRMLDGNEADDKIVAVLEGDAVYGGVTGIESIPDGLLNRLHHYFLTYKQAPGEPKARTEIAGVYGADEARDVIERSREDYRNHFFDLVAPV
jgi:inorganic pyrophosphatase